MESKLYKKLKDSSKLTHREIDDRFLPFIREYFFMENFLEGRIPSPLINEAQQMLFPFKEVQTYIESLDDYQKRNGFLNKFFKAPKKDGKLSLAFNKRIGFQNSRLEINISEPAWMVSNFYLYIYLLMTLQDSSYIVLNNELLFLIYLIDQKDSFAQGFPEWFKNTLAGDDYYQNPLPKGHINTKKFWNESLNKSKLDQRLINNIDWQSSYGLPALSLSSRNILLFQEEHNDYIEIKSARTNLGDHFFNFLKTTTEKYLPSTDASKAQVYILNEIQNVIWKNHYLLNNIYALKNEDFLHRYIKLLLTQIFNNAIHHFVTDNSKLKKKLISIKDHPSFKDFLKQHNSIEDALIYMHKENNVGCIEQYLCPSIIVFDLCQKEIDQIPYEVLGLITKPIINSKF